MRGVLFWVGLCVVFFPGPIWAGFESAQVPEDMMPWSGWWWPKNRGELVQGYEGLPAPLHKYDAYVHGSFPGPATRYGQENEDLPDAKGWHGHCDDWAAAAVLEVEPDSPGDLAGIEFRVGDKKGLLTLHYDNNYVADMYGQRYAGDDPAKFADIHPGGLDGFHETLKHYIAVQGMPVIMDLSPHSDVWNHPAFKYEMSWYDQTWGDGEQTREVTCRVWFADDDVDPDFTGLKTFTRTYTYRLELDSNGDLVDAPGEWTGDSVGNHPDFLWSPSPRGHEPVLRQDPLRAILDCEVTASDDRFEDNDSWETAHRVEHVGEQRSYLGALQDEDWYSFSLLPGDDLLATVSMPNGPGSMELYGPSGHVVSLSGQGRIDLQDIAAGGRYRLRVPETTQPEEHYMLSLSQSPSAFIPHIPGGSGWLTEITLGGSNQTGQEENFNLTYLEPDSNTNGSWQRMTKMCRLAENQVFSETLSSFFQSPPGEKGFVKILNAHGATHPPGAVSYTREHQKVTLPLITSFFKTLYIPHLDLNDPWWNGLTILNPDSALPASVSMQAYSRRGILIGESVITVLPGQKISGLLDALWHGELPGSTAWVEITSSVPVNGHILWGNAHDPSNPGLCGANLLSHDDLANVFYLPHANPGPGWWLGVALFNPQSSSAALTAYAYDRKGKSLGQHFFSIPAHGQWSGLVQDLLAENEEETAWVKIKSSKGIAGIRIYGQKGGQLQASPLQSGKDFTTRFTLQGLSLNDDSWTGMALLNRSEYGSRLYALPFDENGQRLIPEGDFLRYNVPQGMPAETKLDGLIQNFFPGLPNTCRILKVYAEEPILFIVLYGSIDANKISTLHAERVR